MSKKKWTVWRCYWLIDEVEAATFKEAQEAGMLLPDPPDRNVFDDCDMTVEEAGQ